MHRKANRPPQTISHTLTGEQRPYSRRRGTFRRMSPRSSFSWHEGHPGAWEITGRYSYLCLGQSRQRSKAAACAPLADAALVCELVCELSTTG